MKSNCFCETKEQREKKKTKEVEAGVENKEHNRGKSLKLNTVCNQKFRN